MDLPPAPTRFTAVLNLVRTRMPQLHRPTFAYPGVVSRLVTCGAKLSVFDGAFLTPRIAKPLRLLVSGESGG